MKNNYNLTTNIAKLIDDGKFLLAKKIILEELEKTPYDNTLNIQLSRIYSLTQNYEQALQILEQLDETVALHKKMLLYIKLNKEDKVLELYQKYFLTENNLYIPSHLIEEHNNLITYLNKKYNPNYHPDINTLSYTQAQIYSYDKQRAIKHILNNHCFYKERGKTYFANHVNIINLYEEISEYIKNHNNSFLINNREVYFFHYPECGKTNTSGYYDCLGAYTYVGCKDILTMFPHKNIKQRQHLYLTEKPEIKTKTKIKTGLDRFNERYNK